MKSMFSVVLIVSILATASSRPTELITKNLSGIYKNCSSYPEKNYHVSDVIIPGCSAPPCTFVKGKLTNVSITFVALPTASVKDKIYVSMCGSIGPICPSLVPKDPNLCDLGAKCPIKPGDTNTVIVQIPISKSYPSNITLTAFMYFEEKEGDTDRKDSIECFEVAVSLKD